MTITIIGLLAALALGGLQSARQTARVAKTKALIAKLDQVVMQKYQSYMTRRVPIRIPPTDPKAAAEMRLAAIRDLMRMEMPERWGDLLDPPVAPITRPAISELYKMQLLAAKAAAGADPDKIVARYGPAECLYMIVATGTPGAMENFRESEVGDADGDGLMEFHDAWGQPIMFLRWAPGFTGESEIQNIEDHDPFDSRGVDPATAYHLIPLIYSAGPDKEYDIMTDYEKEEDAYHYDGHPYDSPAGLPVDEDGDGDGLHHYDNIHNHSAGAG